MIHQLLISILLFLCAPLAQQSMQDPTMESLRKLAHGLDINHVLHGRCGYRDSLCKMLNCHAPRTQSLEDVTPGPLPLNHNVHDDGHMCLLHISHWYCPAKARQNGLGAGML